MSYDELAEKIVSNDGVLTMEMWELRDIHGAMRLGVNVVAGISQELSDQGLGHFPQDLPLEQSYQVRVYKKSHPVGRVIEACLQLGDKSDKVIRGIVNNEAEMMVRKMRELVCG